MKDLNTIRDLVIKHTGIDIVNGKSRTRKLVNARYLFFKLAKRHTHFSDKLIAKTVGKDRTTVIYGTKDFDVRMRYEPELNDIYRELDVIVCKDVTNQIPKVNGIINMLPKADSETIEQVYKILRRDRLRKKMISV